MNEYRKLATISYKNQDYIIYLDKNNKRFFTKLNDDGSETYVDVFIYMELANRLANPPHILNIEKEKKKYIIPKILIGGALFTVSMPVVTGIIKCFDTRTYAEKYGISIESTEQEENIKESISYSNEKDYNLSIPDQLIVDTYREGFNGDINVFDSEYLDKIFPNEKITLDDLKGRIQNNSNISLEYKNILNEYSKAVCDKYPNVDLRIFYENLKSLKVIECDKVELLPHTLNYDAYACYVKSENAIYVLKGNEYKKGTWEYQVIFHEISHCLRTGMWEKDGKKIRAQSLGTNYGTVIMDEALNSLFTVSLFDYEERDIAYQLQSNYFNIMINSMDNYDLSDYVNHSLSYFAKKLDEHNKQHNEATTILELINLQYNDYHDDNLKVKQEEFYRIYDYISKMYYDKNITSNMTYSQAKAVADDLIDKVMFDVPDEYEIDVDHFYEYFKEYCNSKGIEVTNLNVLK